MGNCLVTKLKAIVDNNELTKFGTIRLKYRKISTPSSTKNMLYLWNDDTSEQPTVISVVSGNAKLFINTPPQDWSNNSDGVDYFELPIGHAVTLYITNEECIIEVSNKYNLKSIKIPSTVDFDFDQLYAPKLSESFTCNSSIKGDAARALSIFPKDMYQIGFSAPVDEWNVASISQDICREIGKRNLEIIAMDGYLGVQLNTIIAGSIDKLRLIQVSGNGVSGDLSVFIEGDSLKYTKLKTITYSAYNQKIICTEETKQKLQSLGVTVNAIE